jgi:hypothetical protein
MLEPARMLIRLLLVSTLLVPATAFADDELTVSYRRMTITADAIGLGLLAAGGIAGSHDDHSPTDARQALWAMGSATMLGTPIIHIARGHTERGVGALLMRGGLAGIGALVGYTANRGCADGVKNGDEFCELDYVGYGVLGGLVVAAAFDAAFLTDEKVERETWAPQAWVNPNGAGAGVSVIW